MADKLFKVRVDSTGNILIKEDLKLAVTPDDIKITISVVANTGGDIFAPYQIKKGIAKRMDILATEVGVPVVDFIISESLKTYSPLYYTLNMTPGAKVLILYKIKVDKQGVIKDVNFVFYDLAKATKEGNVVMGKDITTSLSNEAVYLVKNVLLNKIKFRIDGYVKNILNV